MAFDHVVFENFYSLDSRLESVNIIQNIYINIQQYRMILLMVRLRYGSLHTA